MSIEIKDPEKVPECTSDSKRLSGTLEVVASTLASRYVFCAHDAAKVKWFFCEHELDKFHVTVAFRVSGAMSGNILSTAPCR
eukprot:2482701-Amphidinium_carterae.1